MDVKGDSWDFFDRILKEANVVTTPGAGFGKDGEGYIRIACTCNVETLKEAFDRIERALQ